MELNSSNNAAANHQQAILNIEDKNSDNPNDFIPHIVYNLDLSSQPPSADSVNQPYSADSVKLSQIRGDEMINDKRQNYEYSKNQHDLGQTEKSPSLQQSNDHRSGHKFSLNEIQPVDTITAGSEVLPGHNIEIITHQNGSHGILRSQDATPSFPVKIDEGRSHFNVSVQNISEPPSSTSHFDPDDRPIKPTMIPFDEAPNPNSPDPLNKMNGGSNIEDRIESNSISARPVVEDVNKVTGINEADENLSQSNSGPEIVNRDSGNQDLLDSSLPLAERLKSKVWKIRLQAFEELENKLSSTERGNSALEEYSKLFTNLFKDNNGLVQEKTLEAYKVYLSRQNISNAEVRENIKAVIEKGLSGGRPQMRKICIDILCDLYKTQNIGSAVRDIVNSYATPQNPKFAWGAIQALLGMIDVINTQELEKFQEVFTYVEKLIDSNVAGQREKALEFYMKVHRSIGDEVRKYFKRLSRKQVEELEILLGIETIDNPNKNEEDDAEKDGSKLNTSISKDLSSNQPKGSFRRSTTLSEVSNEGKRSRNSLQNLDRFDEDWSEKLITESKWEERRRLLEDFLSEIDIPTESGGPNLVRRQSMGATSSIKSIGDGRSLRESERYNLGRRVTSPRTSWQYSSPVASHLMVTLKRLLSDSNLQVVLVVIRIYGMLAYRFRRSIGPTCKNVFPLILAKLKDKRTDTVFETTLTLDRFLTFLTTEETLVDIQECLNDKSPTLKLNVLNWLEKHFKTSLASTDLAQKTGSLSRSLVQTLKKLLDDSSLEVREASIRVLALVTAYFPQERDNYMGVNPIKLAKINDLAEHISKAEGLHELRAPKTSERTVDTSDSTSLSGKQTPATLNKLAAKGLKSPEPKSPLKSGTSPEDGGNSRSLSSGPKPSRASDISPNKTSKGSTKGRVNAFDPNDDGEAGGSKSPIRRSKTPVDRDRNGSANIDSSRLVDVSKQVEPCVRKLNDPDWKVRKDALEALENIFDRAVNGGSFNDKRNVDFRKTIGHVASNESGPKKIAPNGLQELITTLRTRLNDHNKSQVKSFLSFVSRLTGYMGSGIKIYAKYLVTDILKNLSDKQQAIRQETVRALDSISRETDVETVLNQLVPMLAVDNPELRLEALNWIISNSEGIHNIDLKQNILPLLAALQDKTKEIRNLAEIVLEKCIEVIGVGPYLTVVDSMKPAVRSMIRPFLEKFDGEGKSPLNLSRNGTEEMRKSSSNGRLTLRTSKGVSEDEKKFMSTARSSSRNDIRVEDSSKSPLRKPRKQDSDKKQLSDEKGKKENVKTILSRERQTVDDIRKSKGKEIPLFDDKQSPKKVVKKTHSRSNTASPTKLNGFAPDWNDGYAATTTNKDNEIFDEVSTSFVERSMFTTPSHTRKNSASSVKTLNIQKSVLLGNRTSTNKKQVRQEGKRQVDVSFEAEYDLDILLKENIRQDLYERMSTKDVQKQLEALQMLKRFLVIEFSGTVEILDLVLHWILIKLSRDSPSSNSASSDRKSSGDDLPLAFAKEASDYLLGLVLSLEAAEYELSDFEAAALLQCLREKIDVQVHSLKITVQKIIHKFGKVYQPNKLLGLLIPGFSSLTQSIRAQTSQTFLELARTYDNELLQNSEDVQTLSQLLINGSTGVQKNLWRTLCEAEEGGSVPDVVKFKTQLGLSVQEKLQKLMEEQEQQSEEGINQQEENDDERMKALEQRLSHRITDREEEKEVGEGQGEEESQLLDKDEYLYDDDTYELIEQEQLIETENKVASERGTKIVENVAISNLLNEQPLDQYDGDLIILTQRTEAEKELEEKFTACVSLLKQGNIPAKLEALLQLQDFLTWDREANRNILTDQGDDFIQELAEILESMHNRSTQEVSTKFMLYFLTMMQKLCSIKPFLENIKQRPLEQLCDVIWRHLLTESGKNNTEASNPNENKLLVKILTALVLKLLENSNPNFMFSILLNGLIETRSTENNQKHVQLVTTCLTKMAKTISQYLDKLNIQSFLLAIHLYLLHFEQEETSRPNEDSIKAIKSILSVICQAHKANIWDYYIQSVEEHPRTDRHLQQWIAAVVGSRPLAESPQFGRPSASSTREIKPIPIKGINKDSTVNTEESMKNINDMRETDEDSQILRSDREKRLMTFQDSKPYREHETQAEGEYYEQERNVEENTKRASGLITKQPISVKTSKIPAQTIQQSAESLSKVQSVTRLNKLTSPVKSNESQRTKTEINILNKRNKDIIQNAIKDFTVPSSTPNRTTKVKVEPSSPVRMPTSQSKPTRISSATKETKKILAEEIEESSETKTQASQYRTEGDDLNKLNSSDLLNLGRISSPRRQTLTKTSLDKVYLPVSLSNQKRIPDSAEKQLKTSSSLMTEKRISSGQKAVPSSSKTDRSKGSKASSRLFEDSRLNESAMEKTERMRQTDTFKSSGQKVDELKSKMKAIVHPK